ncbi:MAG: hypothetical protein HY794_18150 [Desulfarculus sp.]|nr:hypothetical protein [Desulfarculus sp.]
MPPVFCFIDDAQFELDNFAQNAAPAFERARFVYARTFDEARAGLAGEYPLCFLLDIYGAGPPVTAPRIPDPAELEQALGPAADLPSLYEGLEQAGPEAGNLYLRRLHGQVERWQRAFLQAAGGLGQGRAYGLHNLEQARLHYPHAAALGYSRKALYADAVAISLAGAEGLLQKPQGGDDQAIALATRQAAPGLAQAAYAAVNRRLSVQAAGLAARLSGPGGDPALAQALQGALASLHGQGERGPASQALHDLAGRTAGLGPGDRALLESLGLWLEAA